MVTFMMFLLIVGLLLYIVFLKLVTYPEAAMGWGKLVLGLMKK